MFSSVNFPGCTYFLEEIIWWFLCCVYTLLFLRDSNLINDISTLLPGRLLRYQVPGRRSLVLLRFLSLGFRSEMKTFYWSYHLIRKLCSLLWSFALFLSFSSLDPTVACHSRWEGCWNWRRVQWVSLHKKLMAWCISDSLWWSWKIRNHLL